MNAIHTNFQLVICIWACQKYMIIFLFLTKYKYKNKHYKEIRSIGRNIYVPLYTSIYPIFIINFKYYLYMIQMENVKIQISVLVYFWIILKTHTHTKQPMERKRVNLRKSYCKNFTQNQNFLYIIGKRKKNEALIK